MIWAGPGENVKLVVKEVEYDRIKRGNIICGQQFWAMECQEFIAEIDLLELPAEMVISIGFQFALHIHTILEDAEIVALLSKMVFDENESKYKQMKKPKFLMSGECAQVVIRTEKPICLEKYEDFEELGRFAMRLDTFTIGLGKVIKFKPLNKEILKENYYFNKKHDN